MLKLDTIDRKILAALQDNGRLSNVELAERVGLSPSPCLRRVRQLEDAGMISRYVALLNQNAVGLPVSVFISIKLERQQEDDLDRFEAEVGTYPEVLECYLMRSEEHTSELQSLMRISYAVFCLKKTNNKHHETKAI